MLSVYTVRVFPPELKLRDAFVTVYYCNTQHNFLLTTNEIEGIFVQFRRYLIRQKVKWGKDILYFVKHLEVMKMSL